MSTTTRLLLTVVSLSMLVTSYAHAALITVTNTDDSGPGSLRQAVIDAAPGDIINFAVTGTITLTSGEILINKGIAIDGPGPDLLTISGNDASRVFNITDSVSLRGLTISNGRSKDGGGIFVDSGSLLVDNCIFFHNSTLTLDGEAIGNGGAIYVGRNVVFVAITNSAFADNVAGGNGGGVYIDALGAVIEKSSFVHNVARDGGGIFFLGSAARVIDSFFSGNEAGAEGRGGGIYVGDGNDPLIVTGSTFLDNWAFAGSGLFNARVTDTAVVENSTFSRNNRNSALFNADSQSLMLLTSSTFYLNVGTAIGGPARAEVKNSVIVQYQDPPLPGCDGAIISLGGNFSTDNSCSGFTQATHADLHLHDELADNGGPTRTHELRPGSIAIDAVTDCTVAFDQRGVPRPQRAACDAGAFELEHDETSTILDAPPATQYSDMLALHSRTYANGSPVPGGAVEFFLNDVFIGTGNVDNAGAASITTKVLLPPGSYPVKAVYTSSDPAVRGSAVTETLVVVPEAASIVPMASNPFLIAAPGGTFSGTIGPFCFTIVEDPDGSPGDTSTITDIDPSLDAFFGSALFNGFTRTGGGNQPRVICYYITLSGAAPGDYVARAIISAGQNYASDGVSRFGIVDPATVSADLLVSLGVDKLNVKQGELLTYTLTVTNFGPQAALNVVVNDTLSSGSTFASASANRGSFTAPPSGQTGTVTWYPGNFDSNSQGSAQITVTVIVRGNTTITNTATVSSFSADPNPANNSASITSSVVLESGGGKGGGGGGNGGGNGKNR